MIFARRLKSQHSLSDRVEDLLAKRNQHTLCGLGETTKIACFSCWTSEAEVTTVAAFKSETETALIIVINNNRMVRFN